MRQIMNNIHFIKGNIFLTELQTIVNTVNSVGIMGKGIALIHRLRCPEMFEKYREYCDQGLLTVGKLMLYDKTQNNSPWILNFPTKIHWKNPSKIEYIELGLQKFVSTYKAKQITSIAFPMLGTGLGGLDVGEVRDLMTSYLSKCDIPVEIYEFDPDAPDGIYDEFKARWNNIPGSRIKELTHISDKQIEAVNYALNIPGINSMDKLIEFDGIGFKTIEKCYRFVMTYPGNNIFCNSRVPKIPRSQGPKAPRQLI